MIDRLSVSLYYRTHVAFPEREKAMQEASQRSLSLIPDGSMPDISDSFTADSRLVVHLGDSYNFMWSAHNVDGEWR